MADNKSVRDAANATFIGAADELADGSFSPKVSLLAGDGSATPIAPPTAAQVGAVNEAMPGSDTGSSGLNGRLQRLAQRITALASQLPATLSGGGFLMFGAGRNPGAGHQRRGVIGDGERERRDHPCRQHIAARRCRLQ